MKNWSVLIVAVGFLMAMPVLYGQTKQLDVENSKILWEGRKVTGAHLGQISLLSGFLEKSGENFGSGQFVVDMTSIVNLDLEDEATNAKLVGHLKSDDFFGVDKFPSSTLAIKHGKLKEQGVYTFSGNLTIKEKTHPVTFEARVDEMGETLKFKGTLTIDRSKYDVRYGSKSFFDNLGDKIIYDEFKLDFDITLK
jgi:polyisoprenoid-binding protein YceI